MHSTNEEALRGLHVRDSRPEGSHLRGERNRNCSTRWLSSGGQGQLNLPIRDQLNRSKLTPSPAFLLLQILEKTLRILFESCDLSAVKRYVCRQLTKILSGKASIQDLIFAKEFRGVGGYKPGACVPALELTRKSLMIDRRSEPRRGQRVPYVVVNGSPGLPLIRLVRNPFDLLNDEGLRINAVYYITKAIIPPLNRCLLLIGADAHRW